MLSVANYDNDDVFKSNIECRKVVKGVHKVKEVEKINKKKKKRKIEKYRIIIFLEAFILLL